MTQTYRLYQALGGLLAGPVILFQVLRGRYGGHWSERLGYTLAGGGNPVLVHAASVGEAKSGGLIIRALQKEKPNLKAVLAVGTPAGLMASKKQFQSNLTQISAPPLDFYGAPGRFLDHVAPKALIIIETEIWPGLIQSAKNRKIPIIIAAGRLSEKSLSRYRLVSGFTKKILNNVDLALIISKEDKNRYLALGMNEKKLKVSGSPKFDSLFETAQNPFEKKMNDRPLWLAGSTHPGEEDLILNALTKLSIGMRLILAPRHLNRVLEVAHIAEKYGYKVRLYSDLLENFDDAEVIVLDQMGLLSSLYQKADLAFVGGSLDSHLAGHNPFEPAAFGVPVIFGPFMSSFRKEADALLKIGAAREVTDSSMAETINDWLSDPEAQKKAGCGREYLAKREPVAPILAQEILSFLQI